MIGISSADSYRISVIPGNQSCYVGDTLEYQVILDDATLGLAGYEITVSLTNPTVAAITGVTFPAWAQMHSNSPVPSPSVSLTAIDTGHQVEPGSTGITLVTLAVQGNAAGTTPVAVMVTDMDAEGGSSIQPSEVTGGSMEISVAPVPVADFSAGPLSGYQPLAVQFTDASTGPVTSYAWDFNDDGIVDNTSPNPSYTYALAGEYTVNLTVTGPGGTDCEVKPGYITVAYPPPVAGFTANTTFGIAPLAVAFTDLSANGPTGWAWDFEADGIVDSTDQNPVTTYLSAGTYSVELVVSNEGGTDDLTKPGLITVLPAGSHTISVTPANQSCGIGETCEYQVMMNSAPVGLSGYSMTVALGTPGIARIAGVTFPAWAQMHLNTSVPAQSVTLTAADSGKQVSAGAVDITLVTLAIEGDAEGTTPITVTVTQIDGDGGYSIQPSAVHPGNVIVTTVIPLPGYTEPPTDPDGDGLYEDLNGNGVKDLNDVVLFLKYILWIRDNEPVASFDFNGNGDIDLNDVVLLLQDMV